MTPLAHANHVAQNEADETDDAAVAAAAAGPDAGERFQK